MEVVVQGTGVGAAGHVLSRLLLEPPSLALAENFASPQMRATWPLTDPDSAAALAALEPDPYETLPREHMTLFRRHPPAVPLHESAWRSDVTDADRLRSELAAAYDGVSFAALPTPVDDNVGYQVAYLADAATRIGRAARDGDTTTLARTVEAALRFREAHLDRVVGPILEGITQHARTSLYQALPGLLRGFLAGHSALCRAATDR